MLYIMLERRPHVNNAIVAGKTSRPHPRRDRETRPHAPRHARSPVQGSENEKGRLLADQLHAPHAQPHGICPPRTSSGRAHGTGELPQVPPTDRALGRAVAGGVAAEAKTAAGEWEIARPND